MLLLYILHAGNVETVKAQKCRKAPRFSDHFGRTWQPGTFFLDGVESTYRYDNTWGTYWYFYHERQWYKVHIFHEWEPFYMMKLFTHPPTAEEVAAIEERQNE